VNEVTTALLTLISSELSQIVVGLQLTVPAVVNDSTIVGLVPMASASVVTAGSFLAPSATVPSLYPTSAPTITLAPTPEPTAPADSGAPQTTGALAAIALLALAPAGLYYARSRYLKKKQEEQEKAAKAEKDLFAIYQLDVTKGEKFPEKSQQAMAMESGAEFEMASSDEGHFGPIAEDTSRIDIAIDRDVDADDRSATSKPSPLAFHRIVPPVAGADASQIGKVDASREASEI
jgi:hypothetical protein